MKSETYQKEGWFILEEENQVFGKDAEAVDENKNLESEDFNIYQFSKEEAEKNIYALSEDLTDFIDSLTQDVSEPTQEEVNAGIEKILAKTHPAESKTNKSKKVTLKVLFIAALLSALSFCCIYAVGNSYDVSIENGFVAFAKDTIKIVFYGEAKEENITIETLLFDLEAHGYGDMALPQKFVVNSDEYEVSEPEYFDDSLGEQISFDVHQGELKYRFAVLRCQSAGVQNYYLDINDAETVEVNGKYVYVFNSDNQVFIEYFYGDYHFYISSNGASYSELVNIAKTIG